MTFLMNLGKSRNHFKITLLSVYSTTLNFGLLLEQLDILTFESVSVILHKGRDRDPAFSVPRDQAWPSVQEGYFFMNQNCLPLMTHKCSLMPALQSWWTAVWLTHSSLESKFSHLFSPLRLLGGWQGETRILVFIWFQHVTRNVFSVAGMFFGEAHWDRTRFCLWNRSSLLA